MMTDKSHFRITGSHLPLPQRKKRHASDGPETPPPPPPPRDRSVTDIAGISGKRKQPPSLPLRPEVSNDVSRWERSGGRHWSIDDRKHVVSCLSKATDEIRTADVVALSPVEFFRPCRDDLYISNDIVGKNGDYGAPGAKRTSSFFVSGRSASADCGELRMSAAVTMSSSGYDLKANSANSADWYCWTNEDQFAPIYHELDPLVVAQEQLAYSSETSQSASSPSSPYHMYQSIAEVHKEVEQLKSGIADQVGRPSLSLVCDDGVTSGELHESVTVPSNQSSSTKWAIFSRLRLPRRSSPTASSKTSNGNDVTKVNRSTTMTRLSLSPGSFVRNQLASLEKMTSPPHERIGIVSPPSLPADRKQNSPSSPLRRSVDENKKPAASSRYEDSRNPPLALLSRALPTTIDVAVKSVFPFPLPMTPVEFARTPSTLRRATSGDVFFGAETPATARRRAEEQSVNRRPHSDGRKPIASGFLSPATSSLAFPFSSSGTFSSPCCGVRMAEMRAATRRSSITSVTSPGCGPGCGQIPDSTSSISIVAACVSPVSALQTAERSAADEVILDTFALQQRQTRVTNNGGSPKDFVAPPLPAAVASLGTISEEDSSTSRHYYVSIQASMGAATSTTTPTFEQAREHSRDPVSGVGSRSRWTSKSPDDSRLHSLALTDDRLVSGCGHRSRLASAQHRVRHQSADGCRKHSPTAVIDHVLSPSAGGGGARRDTMTSPAAMNVEMNPVMKPSEGRKNCRNTGGSSSIPSFGCSDKNRISASSADRNSRRPRVIGDSQQSKLKVRQQHQRRKPSWELSDSRSTTATDTPPSSSSMSSSDRSASSTLDSEIVPDRVSSSSKNDAVNVDSRTCDDDLVENDDRVRSTCSDRRSRPIDRGGNITGGCRVAVAATKKTSRLRSPRASSAALTSPGGSRTGSPAAVGSKAPSELARTEDHGKSPRRQRIPQWTSSDRNPSNGHHLPPANNSTYDTVYGGSCASSTIEMSSSMTSSSGSSAAGSISATTSGGDCDSPDGVFPVDFLNTRSSKAVSAEGLPSSTDGGPGAITVAETADAATTVDASVKTRLHQHPPDNVSGEEQPPIGQRRSLLRRSGDSDSGWPSESARIPRLKSRDGTGVSRIQPPRTGTSVLLHADRTRHVTAKQPSNSNATPGADDDSRTATPAGIIRSETATSCGATDDKTSS